MFIGLCVCVCVNFLCLLHFPLPLEAYMQIVNSYDGCEFIIEVLLDNLQLQLTFGGEPQYGGEEGT